MASPMYYIRVRRPWRRDEPMPEGSRAFVVHAGHDDLASHGRAYTLVSAHPLIGQDTWRAREPWRAEILAQMHPCFLRSMDAVHAIRHAIPTPMLAASRTLAEPVHVRADYIDQTPGAEHVAGVTLRLSPAYSPGGLYDELSSTARSHGLEVAWMQGACEAMTQSVEADGVTALRCDIVDAMTHPVDTRSSSFAYAMCTAWRMVAEQATWFVADGLS